MYIETVPNPNSPPAVLQRAGWRQGKKTRKRTLANLSAWRPAKVEAFRRLLRDEPLASPDDLLTTRQTLPHGHVEAVRAMMRRRPEDRQRSGGEAPHPVRARARGEGR